MSAQHDVTDFRQQVLEKSHEVPVLVDFWAEWCGPCKVLGPVLERLAEKAHGEWTLAKLDTEQFPEIAAQYNIRGIPAVKLFVDGEVTNEFVGELPDYQVEYWLQQSLPNKLRKQLLGAEYLAAEGKTEEAKGELERILKEDPSNLDARVTLARLQLFDDPARAAELVEGLEEPSHQEMIDAVRTATRLNHVARDGDSLPDGPSKELYCEAAKAFLRQDFLAALGKLIEVIRTDRYYDDDGSRKACIAIFKILGEEHPTTQQFRREFSTALDP